MPPHATLRIRIPVEKEDIIIDKKERLYWYVPVYLQDIRPHNFVYTFIDKMYLCYEINVEPYSFVSSTGERKTFLFGCTEEPIKMIGLLNTGSNYVRVYDDASSTFIPLFKRIYH